MDLTALHVIWAATDPLVSALVIDQAHCFKQLTTQLTALAVRVAELEEKKVRSSRNFSKSPSSTALVTAARASSSTKPLLGHCEFRSLQRLRLAAAGATAQSGFSAHVGRELLELEHQLFHQWYRWRDGQISREQLLSLTVPIRQAFKQQLQWVSDLGFQKGGMNPWAITVRTCRRILSLALAFWTYLEHPAVEPTNNARSYSSDRP